MAAEKIHWKYEHMYSWYIKHQDDPVTDIECIIYHAQRPRGKNKDDLEKFIRPNIKYIGKCPVQSKLYKNGLYTVFDDNKSGKKWLFFVFPTNKDGIVFADHHSFCMDNSDKKTPVHFHITTYSTTKDELVRGTKYEDSKERHYMPSEITMPRSGDVEGMLNNRLDKETIFDVMRMPWTTPSGGAKHNKRTQKEYTPNRDIICKEFDDLWETYGFKSMFAFGIRNGSQTVWNVSFHRKGRRPQGRRQVAYVFNLPRGTDEATFQQTVASLAKGPETTM